MTFCLGQVFDLAWRGSSFNSFRLFSAEDVYVVGTGFSVSRSKAIVDLSYKAVINIDEGLREMVS